MKVDIGLTEESRKSIAEGLGKILADTYTLYLKTLNYHWNVTGPQFPALHALFEQQYMELRDAIDTLAERIRALGFFAPASYSAYLKLSSIKDETDVPCASDMIKRLLEGHECVVRNARQLSSVVEKGRDEGTLDLLTERMEIHEKTAWMLRSMLEK